MKIPTYTQQQLPSGRAGASFSIPGEKRRAIIGDFVPDTGLGSISKVMIDIENKMNELEVSEEFSDAQISYGKGLMSIEKEMTDNPEWKELSTEEYNNKFKEMHDELKTNVLSGMSKYQAIKATENWLENQGIKVETTVNSKARAITIDRNIAKNEDLIESGMNMFQQNGDFSIIKNLEAKIIAQKGVLYSDKEADDLIDGIYTKTAIASTEKFIEDNKLTAADTLKDPDKQPDFFKELGRGDIKDGIIIQNELISKAITVANKEMAELSKVSDTQKVMADQAEEQALSELRTTGNTNINMYDYYNKMYKYDVDKATAAKMKYEAKQKEAVLDHNVGVFIEGKSLAAILPALDNIEKKYGKAGEDMKRKYKAEVMARQAIIDRNIADYYKIEKPNISDSELKALAKSHGVQERYLTTSQAKSISYEIEHNNPEDGVHIISNLLKQKYGEAKYRDIVEIGGLSPSTAYSLGYARPEEQTDAMIATRRNLKDYKSNVDTDTYKEIQELLNEEFTQFEESMLLAGATNAEQVAENKEAALKIALHNSKFMDIKKAVEQAVQPLNNNFTYFEFNGHTVRLPKQLESKVDSINTKLGLYLRDHVTKDILHPSESDDGNFQNLQNDGFYIYSEKHGGMVLKHPNGIPAHKKDGSLVVVPIDALTYEATIAEFTKKTEDERKAKEMNKEKKQPYINAWLEEITTSGLTTKKDK